MRQAGGLIGCIGLLWALSAGSALGAGITNSGNDLRDGWYGNQPGLAPDLVGGSTFGKLWSTAVDGQVYAQPLVHAGHVIVATERNQVLSLDSETGAKTGSGSWARTLPHGTPWNPSDVGCNDLRPDIGVTATPVIDDATKTIYLTHKTYASGTSGPAVWWMDALDAATGDEKPGFPVKIEGVADNAPGVTFDPTFELQRPGLLLMDGVVYAAFGGHCDYGTYQGWVVGVSTAGAIKARWAASDWGAGIWQSGSGLTSDGPGRILLATGNGGAPTSPRPGTKPGSTFGESVVRLAVQPDGSLQPKDFFAPYDAPDLDNWDADFASGGVTALRDDVFGTATYPHLALAVGKSGYVYTLNRDDLGGFRMGANGGDNVISRVGPYGGVWARPAIWPGDGGWMVIPTSTSDTASPGSQGSGYLKMYQYSVVNGRPTMVARAQSTDLWGFSSGSAVITSDGKTSGTALAWAVHADGATGAGAQLRAYDAVPKNGTPTLRFSAYIGTATKFAMPGVGAGRIYVGTRDGQVLGFGAPVKAALQGPSTAFPTTTVGQSVTRDVTLTASGHLTITSVGSTTAPFDATYSGPSTLDAGNTMTVSVTFHPAAPGPVGGAVHVVTSAGTFDFGLNGTGQADGPQLVASPPALSFGGMVAGASPLDDAVTFANEGSEALTVESVDLPRPPFTVEGVPAPGDTIASNAHIDLAVHFAPDTPGSYADEITLHTTGGTKTIGLSGTAGQGGHLTIAPAAGLAFGAVPVGETVVRDLTLTNTGDTAFRITKSKPPVSEAFAAMDPLDEGTTLQAGEERTVRIAFSPQAAGAASSTWVINGTDDSGVHSIALTGEGTVVTPEPGPEPGPGPDSGPGPDLGMSQAAGVPGGTPQPQPQTLAPDPIGPELTTGQSGPAVPDRLRADVRLVRARVARDGRRLTIVGLASREAVGALSITVSARTTGRRTVTAVTGRRLLGGRFVVHLNLPRAARSWRRLTIAVRFAGTDRVAPAVHTLVVVHAR